MPALVVADASPLIGLALIDSLGLLEPLFGTVTITRTVRHEISAGGDLPGTRELEAALRAGWIRVAPTPIATWEHAGLGAGEASTIALAAERPGSRVLMDDALGRARAEALGLNVVDTPGVIAAAARARLVERIEPLLERLRRRGFTVPAEARAAALAAAGET